MQCHACGTDLANTSEAEACTHNSRSAMSCEEASGEGEYQLGFLDVPAMALNSGVFMVLFFGVKMACGTRAAMPRSISAVS
eukprot:5665007-Pyramimonas_sp.AAC.1